MEATSKILNMLKTNMKVLFPIQAEKPPLGTLSREQMRPEKSTVTEDVQLLPQRRRELRAKACLWSLKAGVSSIARKETVSVLKLHRSDFSQQPE